MTSRAAQVFGVAVEAARFSGDENVRKGGLTLLATLLSVEEHLFDDLPPASYAQALNTLNALANADPSKQLRELATQIAQNLNDAAAAPPKIKHDPPPPNITVIPDAPQRRDTIKLPQGHS